MTIKRMTDKEWAEHRANNDDYGMETVESLGETTWDESVDVTDDTPEEYLESWEEYTNE